MYILTLPGERAKLSIKIFHAENDITCTSVDVSLNPWNQKKNCSKNELSLKLWKNKNNYEINNFNKIFYWAIMSSVKHWQGSYSFTLFKFHDFPWLFHDLIKFSMTSGLETVSKTKTLVSTKKHAVHASLYLVLALSSRVTNLPNKTLIFHGFPGLGNEILKFHDFPDFPLPVRHWFVSKNLASWMSTDGKYNNFYSKRCEACVELSICLSNPLLFHVSIPIVVINN